MRFLYSPLILLGIILEEIAMYGLGFGKEPLMIALIQHLVAVVITLIGLRLMVQPVYSKVPYSYLTLLACLSLLLPFLGILLSIVMTSLAMQFNKPKQDHLIRLTSPQHDAEPIDVQYSAGGVPARLRSRNFTLSNKIDALFAMGNSKPEHTNLILQEVLADKQEDLRLLAFGLLQHQGNTIDKQIGSTLEILQTTDDPTQRAQLNKQIAQLYWEFAYSGLNPDMENTMLGNALHHAEAALTVFENHASLWVLLGKIFYRLQQNDKAEQMFERAKQFGAAPENFIPYLAEMAYKQKDFTKLRELFRNAPYLSSLPTVGPVVSFWIKEYDIHESAAEKT